MPRQAMRKRLNAAGLLALSRRCFERMEDGTPAHAYCLVDGAINRHASQTSLHFWHGMPYLQA